MKACLALLAAVLLLAGCAPKFVVPDNLPSWPPEASPSPAISTSPQPGTVGTYGSFKRVESETDGWDFRPYTDIVVTALGYFDGSGDGLRNDHRVAVYEADSQNALAMTVVHSDSELQGAFRWESIRPVLLLTGKTYVVVGETYPPDDREAPTEGTWAPELMRGDYREVHKVWAFPHEHFRAPCVGANFRFKPLWTILGDAMNDEKP